MSHADLVKLLTKYLPGRFVKIWGSAFQEAGLPDFIGCWRGNFVGVECKVPPDKMKPHQLEQMRKFWLAGGITFEMRVEGEKLCCIFWYPERTKGTMTCKLVAALTISTLSKARLVETFTLSESLRAHPSFRLNPVQYQSWNESGLDKPLPLAPLVD